MNEHYGNEVLIFSIDSKRYAMELRYVVETVQSLPVTRVPRLPSFIRGIANLRGNIIPVVRLDLFFDGGGAENERGEYKCLIVLRCEGHLFSILADDVLCIGDMGKNLLDDGIDHANSSGFEKYVRAELTDGDGVVTVLDGERLFHGMTRESAGLS